MRVQFSLSRAEIDATLPPLTLLCSPVRPAGRWRSSSRRPIRTSRPITSSGHTYYCSGLLENPGTGTILGTSATLGHMTIVDAERRLVGFAPQSFCP